jgi:hypothetical protein
MSSPVPWSLLLGALLLAGCKRELPPPPIMVNLTRAGTFEQRFDPDRNEPTVWSVIVVNDGRDADRTAGDHPALPDLQLRLKVVDGHGAVVSDQRLDQTSLTYGHGWTPPDSAILVPEPLGLRRGQHYVLTMEVVSPTAAVGETPTMWRIVLPGK